MAIVYHFDLYPRTDPVNGALVRRLVNLQEAEYRGEANGTGSGRMVLRGTSADAAFIDPAGMQYIRVVRDDGATEVVVGGFFLENGEFEALTERSTKKLTFGGAGTLSYLGRAIAADEAHLTSIATSSAWKVTPSGSVPAGWHDVGFNDSAYANAVRVSDPRWYSGCSRRWIWEDAGVQGSGEERAFRKEFELPTVPAVPTLLVTADQGCEVYLNGTLVATVGDADRGGEEVLPREHESIFTFVINPALLTVGTNCISIIGWNATMVGADTAAVYAALTDPDLPGPDAGLWSFPDEPLGAVLWRMVSEAQSPNRAQQPIPGVTMTFSRTLDSDGNAWTGTNSITAQVGENLLGTVQRVMAAGLYVWMEPDTFELSAWPATAHGRARTGVAWGSSVVRFQAPTDGTIATGNIKSDAKRGIGALIKRSDLLVGGSDIYEWVNDPAADLVWEGGYQVTDPACLSLAELGTAQLQARSDAGDTVRLRMMLDNSPANGKYLPFETAGILLDDTVTLHNGTGQWDWDETEQKVAAISLKLRPGGDWDAWVDLGSQYSSIEQRAFQVQPVGAHTHPPNPMLCDLPAGGFIETGADWKIKSITGSSEPAGWKSVGFDDSAWEVPGEGTGASGLQVVSDSTAPGFVPLAVSIARKEHTVAASDLSGAAVVFKYAIDNAGAIWVNGTLVATLTGNGAGNYTSDHATTLARSYFVEGVNVIALRIENEDGTLGGNPPASHSGGTYIAMPVDGFAATGSSSRAARCDHNHAHNDLLASDGEEQHPAAGITYDPTASGLTATEVQAALDELAAGGATATDLAPGSLSNIATTGGYLAFPGVAKLDADHLVLVYRQGTDHLTTQDGKIVYRIGTIGTDYAVTWGSQSDVYDDPSLDCRDPEVTVLSDGSIICSFFTWNGSTTYALKVVKATWNGSALTWGSPITVSTSYSVEVACSAKVVELFNGDLLLPFYGRASGTNDSCSTVRSTDGGATWSSQVTIVSGTVGSGANWTEPYIVLLADGTLHCLIREATDEQMYRTVSTDGGATWATVAFAYEGNARPAHIQVQSGGLLLVSRADPVGDTIYRVSIDDGLTWSAEVVVDSAGSSNQYASIVQLDHYRYGVAYCIENSSTDADVKWVMFTDAAVLDILARLGAGTSGVTDHGALTGLGDDDHTQYATNAEFDDHNARHEPGGGDPMAVDAAAATGSLRTLGTTSTTAAAGNHSHASGIGPILISDTPSTPLIFADLIQNEAQNDLVYADP